MGVKNSIVQQLLLARYSEGDCLPSVRSLMKAFGASSVTVQGALKLLAAKGMISSVPGKGNFWGHPPKPTKLPVVRESVKNRLERLFHEDLERGFLKLQQPLPSIKEMELRYHVSLPTLRSFLQNKIQQGILQKNGRNYEFVTHSLRPRKSSYAEILFVTRCNAFGGFSAESEREMDFVRYVYRKVGASHYKLILLGYHETTGRLLERNGNVCKLANYPNAVGALISTLLVQSPLALLHIFSKVSYPVSIWWEHPEKDLPKVYLKKDNWFVFNSSFGAMPGMELGKFLLKNGFHSVVYISPYHGSSWSKDRLAGIKSVGIDSYEVVDDSWASPWDFKQRARREVEKLAVDARARRLTQMALKRMLENLPEKNFSIPWVCVNDEVAFALKDLEENGDYPISRVLIAFDNSAESYLIRLPSYDFNTENLVDQMFGSLENPNGILKKHAMLQIRGIVVEK